MGIGYFQLTVTSEQDKYLVGNPQFTYFKSVHKRHTNFAIENRVLNFVGETTLNTNSNFGKKYYAKIPKIGDLLHRMYIVFELESASDLKSIQQEFGISAHSLIDNVQISIGDQVIDKHTGDWLHIFSELNGKGNISLCDMLNTHLNSKGNGIGGEIELKFKDGLVYVPLQFWFNRNVGLSLPLMSLQYSDVKIELQLNKRSKITNIGNSGKNNSKINQIYLLSEFIHLDKDERVLFASNQHEYLIEQVQINDKLNVPLKTEISDLDFEEYTHKFELPFNHPVKELIWVLQDSNSKKDITGREYIDSWNLPVTKERTNVGNHLFNYWRNLDWENQADQLINATISLNGTELCEPQGASYFRNVQKYQYHSDFGYDNLSFTKDQYNYSNADLSRGSGIYSYSFSLNPENHEPSGSLNFSKLDKTELRLRIRRDFHNNSKSEGFSLNNKILKIFALNYNVLRVMSGHAGLVFQN